MQQFQSTHPMRDATFPTLEQTTSKGFQSTHPMRDATAMRNALIVNDDISIHASHAGCDTTAEPFRLTPEQFQSTHPMRDATELSSPGRHLAGHFNPRIPCGMRRPVVSKSSPTIVYFNPRIPCGMRLKALGHNEWFKDFNPRIPCGMRRNPL